MNDYEITYIISGKATEEARDQVNSEFEKLVSEAEGKIEHASAALRRQLAYDVKKERAGFVRLVNLALDPSHIEGVHRFLMKHKDVLRFTILQTPRREELSPDVLRSLTEEQPRRAEAKKPAKEVTMEDVEKGIEEALTEEIK